MLGCVPKVMLRDTMLPKRSSKQRVPSGKVYAVDIDSNMIKQARRNLPDLENVEVVHSDIGDVNLPTKLEGIFSSAALPSARDDTHFFQHFWEMLKHDASKRRQLLIRCGGYGKLRR
jgi:trans-aconitate 2-methyltransferase